MNEIAVFSTNTYIGLIKDMQEYSITQLVRYCEKHDMPLQSIPLPSTVYIAKFNPEVKLSPLAYTELESEDPVIVCIFFASEEPSFNSIKFSDFHKLYEPLTSVHEAEKTSKLSVVQPTNVKS